MLGTKLVELRNLGPEGRKVRLAFGVAFLTEALFVALVMKLFGAGPPWAFLPFVLPMLGVSLVPAWRTGVRPLDGSKENSSCL